MIIKRKVFSKMSENTKDKISTVTGAGLGAGAGYGITKIVSPENLTKLGDVVEFKLVGKDVMTVLDKNGKPFDKVKLPRGGKYKKVADAIKSDKVAKVVKNPVTKAAIIGGTAVGVGAGIRKSIKNKKK